MVFFWFFSRIREMFDLEFFRIVHKILGWTESPPSQFVSKHVFALHRRSQNSYIADCMQHRATMSTGLVSLHAYVRKTYPAYFDLKLHVSDSFAANWNSALAIV